MPDEVEFQRQRAEARRQKHEFHVSIRNAAATGNWSEFDRISEELAGETVGSAGPEGDSVGESDDEG